MKWQKDHCPKDIPGYVWRLWNGGFWDTETLPFNSAVVFAKGTNIISPCPVSSDPFTTILLHHWHVLPTLFSANDANYRYRWQFMGGKKKKLPLNFLTIFHPNFLHSSASKKTPLELCASDFGALVSLSELFCYCHIYLCLSIRCFGFLSFNVTSWSYHPYQFGGRELWKLVLAQSPSQPDA